MTPDRAWPPQHTSAQVRPVSSALADLAGLLLETDSFHDVMQCLAQACTQIVPNVLTAGITVANAGRIITVAAADALGRELDERQYDLDEGPCLESMYIRQIVDAPDMASETRWGDYPRQVVELGVGSVYSSPLVVRNQSVGVLNLYSALPNGFTGASRAAAAELVTVIVVTVTATLRNFGDATLADQLQQALGSRSAIDQAVGIIIATQRLNPDEAFATLRRASQHRNIRLPVIAQELIDRTAPPSTRTSR